MADFTRKLAAIIFTDIVGFTKLSSENEPAALALLETQRDLLKPVVDKYNGEWLKEIGDGLLFSFNTNRDAVDCSMEIQQATKEADGLNLRIRIHQSEVVFQGSDVVEEYVDVGDPPSRWYLMADLTHKPESFAEAAVWCLADNTILSESGTVLTRD